MIQIQIIEILLTAVMTIARLYIKLIVLHVPTGAGAVFSTRRDSAQKVKFILNYLTTRVLTVKFLISDGMGVNISIGQATAVHCQRREVGREIP